MKLPKQQRDEIVKGLLPLLINTTEQTERVRRVMGRTLIYQGVTKDKGGKNILPGKEYVFSDTVQVPVNHKRRILEVIDRAPTMQGMEEDLARYLVKFGQSKEAITESIKSHKN